MLAAGLACVHVSAAERSGTLARYPEKPVRLVTAAAAGGGMDIIARSIAQSLTSAWPHPVIVDNRGGAGGLIGTEIVAKAVPDGYTLLLNGPGGTYLGALKPKLSFDPARAFAPIALVARQPWALAVHPSVAAQSIAELIELAKRSPGALRYGSGGVGSASHMGMELFRNLARISITHVAYKGTGPATTALLGGEIQMLLVGVATIVPQAKAGRVKLLAVTSPAGVVPELRTISESGVRGYDFDIWYGLFAPAGTPAALVEKINGEVNRSLQQPDLKARFASDGVEPGGGTAQSFQRHFNAEVAKWHRVVREAGIRSD
jgi:tripartite-type tricarboxylate transporter receptor subunit TctC